MARQTYADNVDANGKVFKTVGDNIREGARAGELIDFSTITDKLDVLEPEISALQDDTSENKKNIKNNSEDITKLNDDLAKETSRAKQEEKRIESLFTDDVETSVSNWLDAHPEATTTVQDASLTEYKFTANLKHHTLKDYVTPEMFGAVGDGITDDTTALNMAIENSRGKILLLKGVYATNQAINITDEISIKGINCNGLSAKLGGISSGIVSSAEIAINIDRGENNQFSKVLIEGIGVKSTNGNGTGILAHNSNHLIINNCSIMEYTNGTGIQLGKVDSFGGQYIDIINTSIGNSLNGIVSNQVNGINIINCMFDGNNNGSDISEYTYGFRSNSTAINFKAGDGNRVEHSRIQGFENGIISNSSHTILRDLRGEMCKRFITLNSSKNFVDGCNLNNHLLLEKNAVTIYGSCVKLNELASNNNIGYLNVDECYGIEYNNKNNYGTSLQNVEVFLGTITESTTLIEDVINYFKLNSFGILDFKIRTDNIESLIGSYSDRWYIGLNGKNKELYTDNAEVENGWVNIYQDNVNINNNLTFTLIKNGNGVPLTNLRVKMLIALYPIDNIN